MTTGANLAAALCEVCYRARTLKMSRGGRFTPRGYDYRDGTCDLKCEACDRITRHALVLPAGPERDRSSAAVDPYAVLARLGWSPVVAPGMTHDACLVPGEHIVLYSDRLTPEEFTRLTPRLIDRVLDLDRAVGSAE